MPFFVDELKTSVPNASSHGGVSIGPVETSVADAPSRGGVSIGPVETSVPEAGSHVSFGPVETSAVPEAKPKVDPAAIKAAFGHLAE